MSDVKKRLIADIEKLRAEEDSYDSYGQGINWALEEAIDLITAAMKERYDEEGNILVEVFKGDINEMEHTITEQAATITSLQSRIASLEGQWVSVEKHGWPKVDGLYVIDLVGFSPVVDKLKDREFVDYAFEEIIQYMPISPPKE